MTVNFKGAPTLQAMLAALGRITVVNATHEEDGVRILCAMLIRHTPDGKALADTAFGLDLGAGMNVPLDPMPPMTLAPAGMEVLLRLQITPPDDPDGSASDLIDLYLKVEGANPAVKRFEVGLRRHDGEIDGTETLVPAHPDFAAWARALV